MYGWICLKCGRSNAPWVQVCPCFVPIPGTIVITPWHTPLTTGDPILPPTYTTCNDKYKVEGSESEII